MSPETIDLEQALRLLSLPRVVGADPADGEEIQALNGRYGPYIKKGTDTRSLEEEDQIFTITLEDALERLSKPKERRRRGGTAAQGARAGPRDAETDRRQDRPLRRLRHRQETNASLRAGDDVETITPERAAELLADRRARGTTKPRRGPSPGQEVLARPQLLPPQASLGGRDRRNGSGPKRVFVSRKQGMLGLSCDRTHPLAPIGLSS